jgi:predicted permease
VNTLVLKPPAVHAPDELVAIYAADTTRPDTYRSFSMAEFKDLRAQASVFAEVAAQQPTLVGLKEGDTTRRVMALQASASYFNLLGIAPARGRAFLPAEDTTATPVAIVSDAFWRKTGADPGLVGKTITVNATAFTVVGIMPPGFGGTMSIVSLDVFTPLGMYDVLVSEFENEQRQSLADPRHHGLTLLGRLKPGVTPAAVNARLRDLAAQFASVYPDLRKDLSLSCGRLPAIPFSDRPQSGPDPLKLLSALMQTMACVVLLIACLNLANLMLARGAGRRKEIAVRLALGATRRRIIRQLLTEGLLLALLGGAFGLVLARWSTDLLFGSLQQVASMFTVPAAAFDWRVLGATGGFCVLAALSFALGPALKLARLDVNRDLKEHLGEDAGLARRHWFTPRNLLVPAQVALSLALLVAAGLFTRSAVNAVRSNPGFGLDSGFFLQLDAAMARRDEAQARETFRALTERLGALPGVASVSLAATIPFGDLHMGRSVQRAGAPPPPSSGAATLEQGRALSAGANIIGDGYFQTLAVPLLRGREFTRPEATISNAPAVAILSRRLAEQLWPGEDALGRRIQFAEAGHGGDGLNGAAPGLGKVTYEVIGLVPNLRRNLSADEEAAFVYLPFGRHFQLTAHLHVRPAPGASATMLMAAVREQVRAADPQLPVLALKSLRTHFDGSFYLWIVRVGSLLFGTFGTVALLLAVIGVYGVKAYTVARRTREIGIRMALGAGRGVGIRMILGEGAASTFVGLGIGLLLAGGAAMAISGFLFEVEPFDPIVFVAAPLLLAIAALLACWLPARRASRVDPMVALRSE